jgi:hypothetical protein
LAAEVPWLITLVEGSKMRCKHGQSSTSHYVIVGGWECAREEQELLLRSRHMT